MKYREWMKKHFVMCGTAFFAAAALMLYVFAPPDKPDVLSAPREELGKYMAGKGFHRLAPGERRNFMRDLKKRGIHLDELLSRLSAGERDDFRRNMEVCKQERLREFFDMPPLQQEQALREAWRDRQREMSKGAASSGTGEKPSNKKSLEGGTPEDRARSNEFARRLKNYSPSTPVK